MRTRNPTVNVGIPVYNEEWNIVRLIKSLAIQQGIEITKTIIIDDGSTDKTIERIYDLDDFLFRRLNIKIIKLNKNMGKANALNIIFRTANEKYLILLDADVVLNDKYTLRKLIEPLIENENLCLVSGWYEILLPSPLDFISRACRFSSYLLKEIARNLNNIYGATGVIMALNRDCYKHINIPLDVIRDDAFIYLFVKYSLGKEFRFNPDVKVLLLRMYHDIRGFLNYQNRTRSVSHRIREIFGNKAFIEQRVPLPTALKCATKAFLREPIGFFSWSILKKLCFLISLVKDSYISYSWRHHTYEELKD